MKTEVVIGKNLCLEGHKMNSLNYFVVFVKNTLEEEVSIVVKLRGAIRRDLYSVKGTDEINDWTESNEALSDKHEKYVKMHKSKQNSTVILHLQGEQVFLRQLQVIVITKPPENGPGGLVSTSLYKQGV